MRHISSLLSTPLSDYDIELTGQILLFPFVGALIEIMCRVLRNPMHGNELLLVLLRRNSQIEEPLSSHHLLIERLVLTLVAEILNPLAIRCTIVRAWKNEIGDAEGLLAFGIESLDEVALKATGMTVS